MVEFFEVIAEYFSHVEHTRSGEVIPLRAKVMSVPDSGVFSISYSHTFRATEEAAGFYYSNSFSQADSPENARALVQNWAQMLSNSSEVGPWTTDVFGT